MKKMMMVLGMAAALLMFQSCVSDNTGSNTGTDTTTATATEDDGSYVQPVVPNANNPKVQLLLQSPYWVAEHWVNHGDNSQNRLNKGRWWSLKADGTFTFGQWQETLSYGSWAVYNDAEKELIHFDAVNDEYDMEFQMQAVSQLRDYMSWAGTGTYDMKRIAVKAVSLLTMPTKAQFNVPE